jgi:predicted DNA-binding transcriptional regulator YafY
VLFEDETLPQFGPARRLFKTSMRNDREAFGVIWDAPVEVVIRFRQDQAGYVAERMWHPSQSVELQPDGSLILRFRAGGRIGIVRWISAWGDAAEVLAPGEVRDHVRTILRSAAAKYGDLTAEVKLE